MDKGKIAGGILSLTLVGLAIGYVVATGYLILRYGYEKQCAVRPVWAYLMRTKKISLAPH